MTCISWSHGCLSDEWSGDEAAEDSGSDWEKLPRPNQQRPSSDSPTPIPTTPPSSSLATTSPTPKQRKDSEKAAESGAVRPAAQPQAASAAAAEFHDISLEEKKHSGSSEASRSSSEEEMVSPVETSSSFSSSDPPASASSSSPIQETSSSAPHQPNAEAFKESLELSVGSGEASPPPSLDLPSTQCPPPERGAGTLVEPEASRPADSEPRLADSSAQSDSSSASLPEIALPAPETAQQSPMPGSQIQQESELPPVTPAPSSVPKAEGCAAEASSVQQALSVAVSEESTILKTTERGDLVVVGSDHGSPLSNASESKGELFLKDDLYFSVACPDFGGRWACGGASEHDSPLSNTTESKAGKGELFSCRSALFSLDWPGRKVTFWCWVRLW